MINSNVNGNDKACCGGAEMNVADEVIRLVTEVKRTNLPVTVTSDLYSDLGLDSMMFVCLLLKIEEVLSVRFELAEMGQCVKMNRLIALVEHKLACGDEEADAND